MAARLDAPHGLKQHPVAGHRDERRIHAERQAAENLCAQAQAACPVYKSDYACGAACSDSRTQPRNRAAPGEAPAAADWRPPSVGPKRA